MAPLLVTLNDLEGHFPVAGLFTCNPSNILQYITRFQPTARSRGPSATAGLLVPLDSVPADRAAVVYNAGDGAVFFVDIGLRTYPKNRYRNRHRS